MEVETQLQTGTNLGYLKDESLQAVLQNCAELGRVLNGLLTSVTKQSEENTGG